MYCKLHALAELGSIDPVSPEVHMAINHARIRIFHARISFLTAGMR